MTNKQPHSDSPSNFNSWTDNSPSLAPAPKQVDSPKPVDAPKSGSKHVPLTKSQLVKQQHILGCPPNTDPQRIAAAESFEAYKYRINMHGFPVDINDNESEDAYAKRLKSYEVTSSVHRNHEA